MQNSIICIPALIVGVFTWTNAQSQTAQELENIANMMVRLCVGGGSASATKGSGAGGVDLSLRSLDATGKVSGSFTVSKSKIEGLQLGLDSAIDKVSADQADKVRACLQPVRDRILEVMLPQKSQMEKNNISQFILDDPDRCVPMTPANTPSMAPPGVDMVVIRPNPARPDPCQDSANGVWRKDGSVWRKTAN